MEEGGRWRRNSASFRLNHHPGEILGNQLGIRIQALGESLVLMWAAGLVLMLRRFPAMAVTMAGGVMLVERGGECQFRTHCCGAGSDTLPADEQQRNAQHRVCLRQYDLHVRILPYPIGAVL
jgi:hypothetical protein